MGKVFIASVNTGTRKGTFSWGWNRRTWPQDEAGWAAVAHFNIEDHSVSLVSNFLLLCHYNRCRSASIPAGFYEEDPIPTGPNHVPRNLPVWETPKATLSSLTCISLTVETRQKENQICFYEPRPALPAFIGAVDDTSSAAIREWKETHSERQNESCD